MKLTITEPIDWNNRLILAPLTRGGNLPFRRLAVSFGADITVSEMAYARKIIKNNRRELALLRRHPDEKIFGVQLAASKPGEALEAAKIAVSEGADFIDLNCGCPIHDTVRRGMGAALLERKALLGRIVEVLSAGVSVPVTVKIRSGWSAKKVRALELSEVIESSGAQALTLHPRTREQRYTKAADWSLVREVALARKIPVAGNGDILTWFEAKRFKELSECAALMIARGALIKPWIFTEIKEEKSLLLSWQERVEIYFKLTQYMKEHFGADDKGRKRSMYFLPFNIDFMARYRPLPEEKWEDKARLHPLIQTRLEDTRADLEPAEQLLRSQKEEVHREIASVLWQVNSEKEACGAIRALAEKLSASFSLEQEDSNLLGAR
ncbi:MAG: tRNA-dihydrouridine synthase family protein [Candidatus Dadabacteria bacterium]|nr:MAG: tRNA-dihydrouridine synthase family protein [Candidatus Dadabacteria bacterium]